MFIIRLVTLFVIISSPIWAIDTLEVTTAKAQSQFSQNLKADTLLSSQFQHSQNLAQRLKFLGFEVREEGGVGSFQPYFYRGLDAQHIPLSINGFKLSSIDGQVSHLSKISLIWADTITLDKSSINDGHFAEINIQTPKDRDFFNLSLSYPFGTESHLGLNNISGDFTQSHLFSTSNYPNRFEYLDRNRTPYNKEDDQFKTLENGEFNSFNSFHQFDYKLAQSSIFSQVLISLEGGGLHGKEGLETDSAGHSKFIGALEWGFKNKSMRISHQVSANKQKAYWSPRDNIYYQTDLPTILGQSLLSQQIKYNQKIGISKNFKLPFIVKWNHDYRQPEDILNPKFNWNWQGNKHQISSGISPSLTLDKFKTEAYFISQLNFEEFKTNNNSSEYNDHNINYNFGLFNSYTSTNFDFSILFKRYRIYYN